MSNWHIYDSVTGQLKQQLVDANGPLDDLQPGEFFVSGHHNPQTRYVVNDIVVPRPAFPIAISNNEEDHTTGKFRLDSIPTGTVVHYDTTDTTVIDGYFELTSATADTVPVTLTLFPYLTRTIDAIFT